jgi:parallel beta-helix repeat protein
MRRRVVAVFLYFILIASSMIFIDLAVDYTPTVEGSNILYVNETGSGGAYTSIQQAIYLASEGDTIYVYNGTYNEKVLVNIRVNLVGEDANSTIIDGDGTGTVLRIQPDFVNMNGFTVTNAGHALNDAGIELSFAQNCMVSNNIVTNNRHGIRFHSASNNDVYGNTIFNNSFSGISAFSSSDQNRIWGNNITNNLQGIHLYSNNANEIWDNSFSLNIYDIYIKESSGASLSGNIMEKAGIFFQAYQSQDWNTHDIDTSNMINGKPVIYWKDRDGGTVPGDAGQVILGNCTNVRIEGQILKDVSAGITIGASTNIEVIGNTITGTQKGIYVLTSDYNNLTSNTASGNERGISLHYSDRNLIRLNDISLNYDEGINLSGSDYNIVVGNDIESNGEHGICLQSSSYNSIFHNNMLYSPQLAYDDGNESVWDTGYPHGGNFWSNYNGQDNYKGAGQNETGSDEIGDSPYNGIEGMSGNKDRYPLMSQWTGDDSPPNIVLLAPENNSMIKLGDYIFFAIIEPNSYVKEFELTGGYLTGMSGDITAEYWSLYTWNWHDGDYTVEIYACDLFGYEDRKWFSFTVDSFAPYIGLISPENNSFLIADEQIELEVSDSSLEKVTYTLNGGATRDLADPYSIDTSSWEDGRYNLTIIAEDGAGNINEKLFHFTKDTKMPVISLEEPQNNSLVLEPVTIDFAISDDNLDTVTYSIDNGFQWNFLDPYDIDTTDWIDGEYVLTIKANDLAGHKSEKWFVLRIDTSEPEVLLTIPDDQAEDVPVLEGIAIMFSEEMDKKSVESALSIDPHVDYTTEWLFDNRTLFLNFSEPLEPETRYSVSISSKAEDMAGRGLDGKYEFEFLTGKELGVDGDEFPMLIVILGAIIAIVVVVILIFVMSKKKTPKEAASVPMETPDVFQIRCSNCNNALSVTDTGVTQNVSCPFCTTLLKVQSQRAPAQAPQPQMQVPQQMFPITCPSCKQPFNVAKTTGPVRMQCPNCGASGTLRF